MAGLGLVAVVGGTATGAAHLRQVELEAQQSEEVREATLLGVSRQLDRAIDARRTALTDPARDGRDAAAALRILIAETITGWERDDDALLADLTRRVQQLRDAADRLEQAGRLPPPDNPASQAVADINPVLGGLQALSTQARAAADHLRASADAAETIGTTALALHVAASGFVAAGADLPDRDDPDAVAAAWRDDLDRLEPYQEAAANAAQVEALADLAAVHLDLLDNVRESGEIALDDLEAGDVDAYNRHREAELEEVAALHDLLIGAMEQTLPEAVAEVEAAEERALGLITELERFRRDTSAQLSAAPRR